MTNTQSTRRTPKPRGNPREWGATTQWPYSAESQQNNFQNGTLQTSDTDPTVAFTIQTFVKGLRNKGIDKTAEELGDLFGAIADRTKKIYGIDLAFTIQVGPSEEETIC